MRLKKSDIVSFVLLVVIASLYRVFEGRPLGFVPQIAMAVFGGAVISDRKMSFAFPLLSMLLSDILFEILYINGISAYQGFYEGQVINYLLFAALTFFGFFARNMATSRIIFSLLAAPMAYFLVSNFLVWAGGGGYARPLTVSGMMQCYADALPFFRGNLMGTLVFGGILFGGYALIQKTSVPATAGK